MKTRVVVLALTTVLFTLLSAVPATAAPAVHKASGGGSFVATGNEFMFAFTARQLDVDGNAKGQFEFHNRTNGNMMHMKIVYVAVEGDEIWLGGIVTKAVNTNAQIGDERVVRLQDNGEGRNMARDRSSKLSNQAASNALAKPPLTSFPLVNGNVQIR